MLRRRAEENVEAGCDIFEVGCNMLRPEDVQGHLPMVPTT